MLTAFRSRLSYFFRPVEILRSYPRSKLRPDALAGLTVAVISLPQAIAYGLVAGVSPVMGLYTAIVAPIVGALWGSSAEVQTSPTTIVSLLVLASLSSIIPPNTPSFFVAAGLVAVVAGIFQLLMGLAHLGILVNFISDSLIVGFASGAGILIAVGELRHLFGLQFSSGSLIETLANVVARLPQSHLPTFALGLLTIVLMVTMRKFRPKWPATLISLVLVSAILFLLRLDRQGVEVIGQLPQSLPPLTLPPIFDLRLIGELSTGALAIAAVGLIQTMAIARSLAAQTGERLDSNQEFVGQGLANVACGFLSGYPCSGSLSCSAINYEAGAQTPLAAIFSGVFTLAGMIALAPLAVYLPRVALSGVLIVVGYAMVDRKQMVHIWRSSRGDAAIMIVTFLGTLLLRIDFAVLTGILMSLAYYILQTSRPHVYAMVPDKEFRHFVHVPARPQCPQLGILDILGDLYFGAANEVERAIHRHQIAHLGQRFLLLRMQNVLHCDITGINALRGILRTYREQSGDIFMMRVREPVLELMKSTGFYETLGADHFLTEDMAIEYLFYKVLDPAICIYESNARVFRECQNLPQVEYPIELPLRTTLDQQKIPEVPPGQLWQQVRGPNSPLVIDVREPREFQQGHIPQAQSLPLFTLITQAPQLSTERPVVFVCRGGRRSLRAAQMYHKRGYENIAVLAGGMIAWEAAGLLQAVGSQP